MVLELRRLRYFVVLAEELNFRRAAERLHIAQPALSQQIRQLERELGADLVDRRSTGCVLTDIGETVAAEARELISQVDSASERIHAAVHGHSGRLRLAYTRSARGGLVDELVQGFAERYPAVDIKSEMGWHSHNVAGLLEGRIDVAFVRSTDPQPGLEYRTMPAEELLLALPADHPLTESERVTRDQVAGLPAAMWDRGNAPGMYDRTIQEVWGNEGFNRVRGGADDEDLLRAVARGDVIAVVPYGRAHDLVMPGVVLRHFAPPVPTVELALAYRPATMPATARAMIALLDEFLKDD